MRARRFVLFSRPCQSIGWEKHSVSRHVLYNLSVAILDQAIWAQAIPAQVSLVETTWLPTSPSSAKPMLARYARKWKQGNDNRLLASFPGCRRGCFNYKLFQRLCQRQSVRLCPQPSLLCTLRIHLMMRYPQFYVFRPIHESSLYSLFEALKRRQVQDRSG